MPYALFVEDHQISRALPTENDVWALCRRCRPCGRRIDSGLDRKARARLEQGYSIREAEPEEQRRCRG